MNRSQNRTRSQASSKWVSACAMMYAVLSTGCEQPIHHAVPITVAATTTDNLVGPENPSEHNWPVRGSTFTVSKPPPLAYLTSQPSKIKLPPPTDPDQSLWNGNDIPEVLQPILLQLFKPLPTEIEWAGEIASDQFAGPQAFDLSLDQKRLVTVKSDAFSLFRTSDGSRIGTRKLPGNWTSSPPMAVRFAPQTNDFLVAAPAKIARISSKTGKTVAEINGPGEAIVKWKVADDESFMIMLTSSGKLFAGDGDLTYFKRLSLPGIPDDHTIKQIGMSFDGVRLSAVYNQKAMTFLQRDGKIIDFMDHKQPLPEGDLSISSGLRDELFAASEVTVYTRANSGPNSNVEFGKENTFENKLRYAAIREVGRRQMLWRPHILLPVRSRPDNPGEWAIGISSRVKDGKIQLVVHDLNLRNRFNSIGLPIDSLPERSVAGRHGEVLVFAYPNRLRIAKWESWRTRSTQFVAESVYSLFYRGDYAAVEWFLDNLHNHPRWTRDGCTHDTISSIVNSSAARLAFLYEKRKLDGDQLDESLQQDLQRLEEWLAKNSFWARTIHAHHWYKRSWRAREGKTVSQTQSWDDYRTFHVKAIEAFEQLLQEPRPAAITIGTYVGCHLEFSSDPAELTLYCQRAIDLYPRSIGIAGEMGFKLFPQWHGEIGDGLAYFKGHANLYEEPEASLVYAQLVGRWGYLLSGNPYEWQHLNGAMFTRGVQEAMNRGMPPDNWFRDSLEIAKLWFDRPEFVVETTGYMLMTNAVEPYERHVTIAQHGYLHNVTFEQLWEEAEKNSARP